MPRSFDSDDRDPVLVFTQNVSCPSCGEIVEGWFYDHSQSLSVGDMVDPPTGVHACPTCEREWSSTYEGWSFYSEAG